MKTYRIPVTWEVYGEMEIDAENINQAVEIAEAIDAPYPSVDGNVEGSLEVDYDLAQELNDGEEIGSEPIYSGGSLQCRECGGLNGKHFLNCSVWGVGK